MKLTCLCALPRNRSPCALRRPRATGWTASRIATPIAACRSPSPTRTVGKWRCVCDFEATWDGGPHARNVQLRALDGFPNLAQFVVTHFAFGIITFHLTYLFRTEPGWNLVATGPANLPKDGIAPLTGVIETDWLPYPFTMNWQMTRPGRVRFQKDEPICMVYPIAADAAADTEARDPQPRRRSRAAGAGARVEEPPRRVHAALQRGRPDDAQGRLAARLLPRAKRPTARRPMRST